MYINVIGNLKNILNGSTQGNGILTKVIFKNCTTHLFDFVQSYDSKSETKNRSPPRI